MELQLRSRSEAGRQLSVLVWRFDRPLRVVASAPHGGGLATRRWIVNAQVPPSYARRDPDHHLRKLAVSFGLPGHGVGMLTAADVRSFVTTVDEGVEVVATVGLGEPEWAAAAPERRPGCRSASPGRSTWSPCCRRGSRTPPSSTRSPPPPRPRRRRSSSSGSPAPAPRPTPCASRPRPTGGRRPSEAPGRGGAPGWPEPSATPSAKAPPA